MKPHLIGHEPMAGEPGHFIQRILTFLNPLLRCPPPVVEVHYALGFGGQIGNDEAHPGEYLPAVPFHFSHHPPGRFQLFA